MKFDCHSAQAPNDKLFKLINSSGEQWFSDHILNDKIKNACKNFPVCLVYKKAPSKPILGLPLANRNKECITVNLKFYYW